MGSVLSARAISKMANSLFEDKTVMNKTDLGKLNTPTRLRRAAIAVHDFATKVASCVDTTYDNLPYDDRRVGINLIVKADRNVQRADFIQDFARTCRELTDMSSDAELVEWSDEIAVHIRNSADRTREVCAMNANIAEIFTEISG